MGPLYKLTARVDSTTSLLYKKCHNRNHRCNLGLKEIRVCPQKDLSLTPIFTVVALVALANPANEATIWLEQPSRDSSGEPQAWARLQPDDLVGCPSTEGPRGAINALAAKFKAHENAFESDAAQSVLQDLLAAEACRHRPSNDTEKIANLVLRSLSNAIAEAQDTRTESLSHQLFKLFPLIEPTLDRFPPKTVAVWQKTRAANQAPMQQLAIWTTDAGTLETDGKTLASLKAGMNQLTIPAELRRVWLRTPSSESLMRYLTHENQRRDMLIFFPRYEGKLLGNVSGFSTRCRSTCERVLQLLANRSNQAWKYERTGLEPMVFNPGNPLQDALGLAAGGTLTKSSTLGLMDFTPFGGAQFHQERVTSGTLWAISQVSLAALSLWQYQRVEDDSLSVADREKAKTLTNMLAAGFYLSIVGSITDGVIWRLGQPEVADQ